MLWPNQSSLNYNSDNIYRVGMLTKYFHMWPFADLDMTAKILTPCKCYVVQFEILYIFRISLTFVYEGSINN